MFLRGTLMVLCSDPFFDPRQVHPFWTIDPSSWTAHRQSEVVRQAVISDFWRQFFETTNMRHLVAHFLSNLIFNDCRSMAVLPFLENLVATASCRSERK